MIIISIGVMGAVIGSLISTEMGLIALIGIVVLITGGMMSIAAINFERMETVD